MEPTIGTEELLSQRAFLTRLQRALAELRGRLDREYGGERRAWAALLAPLACAPRLP